MKYELYYRNILIGNLCISNDYTKYTPNKENISNIDDMIFNFLKEEMDYLHPFLKMRVDKLKKFNMKSDSFKILSSKNFWLKIFSQ